MKAFLSHSSKDNNIVSVVAKHLGRQYCLYDKYAFHTGEEFELAIQRCLDESVIFVLFASAYSLESTWVNFEVDESWHRRIRGLIDRALVYIVDDDIEPSDLPDWLQRALIRKGYSSKAIARDIRVHLDELLMSRGQRYFLGRSKDITRLEEHFTPIGLASAPRSIYVYGLPGIGRRTLLRNSIPNILAINKFVEISIDEGDSINDICIKLADLAGVYSTSEDLIDVINHIQGLNADNALIETFGYLQMLANNGEFIFLLDVGGLLDNEGSVESHVNSIIKHLPINGDIYLALISFRKPQLEPDSNLQCLKVEELGLHETKRLLKMLLQSNSIQATQDKLDDLAEYISGYPPAAYFTAQQAADYGIEVVVRDKRRLVDFKVNRFLKHIQGLNIQTVEGAILQVLTYYSPLPVAVLHPVSGANTLDEFYESLIHLIDLALVIAGKDGLYGIAGPVSSAVINVYGMPSGEKAGKIASTLNNYLNSNIDITRRLDLSRVMYRAASFSGKAKIASRAIRLASDLIKMTGEFYYARDYGKVIEYGRYALSERPTAVTARSYYIRALIQLEHWTEAEVELDIMSKYTHQREVLFLRGFMERKRGNYEKAIEEYLSAIQAGRRGVAVQRELSNCYFEVGDYARANEYLKLALSGPVENEYVIDLWARIATELGDKEGAEKALVRLEQVDREYWYLYRKSRVEWRFGDQRDALESIRKALENAEGIVPFQLVAQAALCEMVCGNRDVAEGHINQLDIRYGNTRRDLRCGLRCRLEIAKKNYRTALYMLEKIINKGTRSYKAIRRDALRGVIEESGVGDEEVAKYEDEIRHLEGEIDNMGIIDFPEMEEKGY